MNFIKLDDARTALSDQKQSLEAKRQALYEEQAKGFKRIRSADQGRARDVWGPGFITIFVLVCFVINAAISLSIFGILEHTVYAETDYNSMSQDQQASMVTTLLASTLILPVVGVIFAFIRNARVSRSTPNVNRLALVNHPDYAIWSEKDDALRAMVYELEEQEFALIHRGLIHIDGARPRAGSAMGALYINDEKMFDLDYNEMPYEIHVDEQDYRLAIRQDEQVLLDQVVTAKKAYAAVVDITDKVECQELPRPRYDVERAKMPRRGTVYVAQ